MGLSMVEFEAQRANLACQHCQHVGLEVERNPNNNGLRPICGHCGSKIPLSGVQWLTQNGAANRKLRRGQTDTPLNVWLENGDHCAFCGKSRTLCERLGIGITVQHVVPVVLGGDQGPLIPFCARCQEMSVAALRETRDVQRTVGSLEEIIARIEHNNPELRGR
jgi:hypothetical protein